MAKRIAITYCILLLMVASLCLAGETPRESPSSAGKTTFTNIAVTGFDEVGQPASEAGQPAYIEMANSEGQRFYLWIGTDNKLRIASEIAVSATGTASPSTVGWQDASGVIVGSDAYFKSY